MNDYEIGRLLGKLVQARRERDRAEGIASILFWMLVIGVAGALLWWTR